MRINQYIAKNLGLSRRQVDELIKRNLIKVDNHLASLGQEVSENNKVEIFKEGVKNWEIISNLSQVTTILFYKPIFCVTTRNDPFKRKTIYHFLPPNMSLLKPAGRLDYMSEGLLVLSSDGELIYELTHPSKEKAKIYLVALLKELSPVALAEFKNGLKIDNYKLEPVEVNLLHKAEQTNKISPNKNLRNFKNPDLQNFDFIKPEPHFNWYEFKLSEGRNNQIRKMCFLFGQKVQRLVRIQQGDFKLTSEIKENGYVFAD